nr:MAG TPA: putative cell adhesion protein [Caudoviricetes sp.]
MIRNKINNNIIMKQLIGISIIASLLFSACTGGDMIEVIQPGDGEDNNTLTLTYTIPDATVGTRSDVSYVEATGTESTVDGLHLLFFNPDNHGNGTFVATASATLKDASLKQNTITVTLPAEVKTENEYSVLVVANLAKYIPVAANLTTYLATFADKTYGQAWEELQALLPVDAGGTYSFPDGRLPMSGTTVKRSGNSAMSVDLLRAAVRIDVKVGDGLTGVTLSNVQLRNIASVVPFFRTQEEISLPRAASANQSVTDNKVVGGLYAVETSLGVTDSRVMLNDATCLLLNIKSTAVHKDADAAKTWYRVNLNINAANMQFLKRNNAYRVVVTGVFTPGSTTPDEAYNNKAMLISTVTILTEWKTSGVTPPDVTIQ